MDGTAAAGVAGGGHVGAAGAGADGVVGNGGTSGGLAGGQLVGAPAAAIGVGERASVSFVGVGAGGLAGVRSASAVDESVVVGLVAPVAARDGMPTVGGPSSLRPPQ